MKKNIARCSYLALIAVCCTVPTFAQATFSKAQVADCIRKVEHGVDQFRKWRSRGVIPLRVTLKPQRLAVVLAVTGKQQPRHRSKRRSRRKTISTNALSDLDRSTNRLRRKFNPLDTWMETSAQMQQVMDDGRKINQILVRGNYGSQAEKYWGALPNNINDLARCYGITSMGA